jgi:hypothetical protein
MQEYIIQVNKIEELQMLKDHDELERIFLKAKSTIIQGEAVVLVRLNPGGAEHKVDEFTTEADLQSYREKTFQYL